MADDTIYRFLDQGAIPGIPAKDLTQADFDRLTLLQKRDVMSGKLYAPVGDAPTAPPNSAPPQVDIHKLTREELDAYAVDHGIENPGQYGTKAELVAALEGGE